jgi:hypothetical protein
LHGATSIVRIRRLNGPEVLPALSDDRDAPGRDSGHLPWFVMLTLKNFGTVFPSMGIWKMSTMSAPALKRVRSARLARHANQSDVRTAPTVPAAAIAAMVCWCALKNSSIIWTSCGRQAPHRRSFNLQQCQTVNFFPYLV